MAKVRANKEDWPNKSRIFIKSFYTNQRGYIWWKNEKVKGKSLFMWKNHKFYAEDYESARTYVHQIEEVF